MKTRTLWLIGFVSFVLMSVVYMPVAFWNKALPDRYALRMQAVQGSLAEGMLPNVALKAISASNVHWRWVPVQLMWGRLAFQVQGQLVMGGQFEGVCGVNPFKTVRCDSVQLSAVPASSLAMLMPNASLPNVSGQLNAKFSTLTWSAGSFPMAEGTLVWQQATLLNTVLGDYNALLTVENAQQRMTVSSQPEALLNVSGELTFSSDGAYQTHVTLKPETSVQAALQPTLDMTIGTADTQGQYHLDMQGMLN